MGEVAPAGEGVQGGSPSRVGIAGDFVVGSHNVFDVNVQEIVERVNVLPCQTSELQKSLWKGKGGGTLESGEAAATNSESGSTDREQAPFLLNCLDRLCQEGGIAE